MANIREYIYPNFIIDFYPSENYHVVVIKNDGYIYLNGSQKVTSVANVMFIESQWNGCVAITKDYKLYYGRTSSWNMTPATALNDKRVVYAAAGNSSPSYLAVTSDDELYGWGANSNSVLGLNHTSSVSTPTKITFPNNEKAFMVSFNDQGSQVLTTSGNVYVAGLDNYFSANASAYRYVFTKVNVSGIKQICGCQDRLYMVDFNGNAYVIGPPSRGVPAKINGISNAKAFFSHDNDSAIGICITEDGYAYYVNGTSASKISIADAQCTGISNAITGTVYVANSKGEIYSGSTTSLSKNTTWSSNAILPKVIVDGLAVELPKPLDGEYDRSPNGLKYKYKVSFIQTDQVTETSNVVNYETTRILSVLRKILIINILYKYIRSLNF